MDWQSFNISLLLGASTCVILVPFSIIVARILAWKKFPGKNLVQAVITLPLLLPPTVLGFYLLSIMGKRSPLGQWYESLFDTSLVFSFEGILVASIIFNLPFAIQPMQRSFEAIPVSLREAAWTCGLSGWAAFRKIELPLAWPGVLTAMILTFAHTLGEFGVILMVGGNISGETRTIAIAIYDRVQAFDNSSAASMSAVLLLISFSAIALIYTLNDRLDRYHGR
jgi:molybdate transport system permease protein